MPRFYRILSALVVDGWYWFLDYLYIARRQVIGFFERVDPYQYRSLRPVHAICSIVLIPGIYEKWNFMKPVANMLFLKGYDVHVCEGLGYNSGSIDAMAKIVRDYIQENKITNAILVAHSKGGLIGKYILANHNSTSVVKGMVALNTPFSGSRYAYLLPFRSLRMFTPKSRVLATLAANRIVNERIVSIYGRFDPHIPGGSELFGAQNIRLDTRGHFRIMNDHRVHDAIIDALVTLQLR